jgi:DUF4097 and DUF4098 domain-containing protein YvlB
MDIPIVTWRPMMKNKGRKFMVLTALAILLTIRGVALGAVQDTIKETFEVGEGGTLTMDSELGSMDVSAQRGNMVGIEVIRRVAVGTAEDAEAILDNLRIEFSQDGNDVVVIATIKDEGWDFLKGTKRKLKLRFIVTVPPKYNVDLRTSGGNISVADLEGKVDGETSGGSLEFGNIVGPVNGRTSGGSIGLRGCSQDAYLKTSGGGIDVGEVDGKVEARTSGGSIRIKKAKGRVFARTSGGSIDVGEAMGALDAETSGGSITARISAQPQDACRLETSGGSVNVYLAEDIKADLDAKTSGGRISTEIPVTIEGELRKDRLRARINGGGPELYLRTSGGNITLRKL